MTDGLVVAGHVKVFTNLWDIHQNGGATSYVPGSHRLPLGPEGHLERGLFKRAQSEDGLLDQRLMPNFVEAALPAGSAIAFESVHQHYFPTTTRFPRTFLRVAVTPAHRDGTRPFQTPAGRPADLVTASIDPPRLAVRSPRGGTRRGQPLGGRGREFLERRWLGWTGKGN